MTGLVRGERTARCTRDPAGQRAGRRVTEKRGKTRKREKKCVSAENSPVLRDVRAVSTAQLTGSERSVQGRGAAVPVPEQWDR